MVVLNVHNIHIRRLCHLPHSPLIESVVFAVKVLVNGSRARRAVSIPQIDEPVPVYLPYITFFVSPIVVVCQRLWLTEHIINSLANLFSSSILSTFGVILQRDSCYHEEFAYLIVNANRSVM